MPLWSRLRRAGTVAVAGLGTVAVLSMSACDLSLGARPDPLTQFVDAVNAGDIAEAADLTDDPAAAGKALTASFDGMGAAEPHLSTVESLRGTLTTHVAWTLPDGEKTETTGTIEKADAGSIAWSPHIIDSRLQPGGRLVYSEELDYDSPVIDRDRKPVMTWQTVTKVTIAADAPAAEVADLAGVLHGIDATITDSTITDGMSEVRRDAAASGPPDGQDGSDADTDSGLPDDARYSVVTLRQSDADPVRDRLDAIPSVNLSDEGRLLTTDPAIRSPALDGVPDMWHSVLSRVGGWVVDIDNPTGDIRVQSASPAEVQNVPTTLDLDIQSAAQKAVDAADRPASIVALSPSTGGVLAVAQNGPADRAGPVSLSGLYPPGSTFKIVTTAAALGAGDVSPDDLVQCPGSVTVDGRTIPNDDGFDLGEVPLHTAFARSCNTTQALLSSGLEPNALADTAHALGLGVDFDTPGLTTATGSVPATDPGPARVEASIGQGDVVASPFGMAVAAASLANNGTMIIPSLFVGMPATSNISPGGLPDGTASAVRDMMRETVESGTAASLHAITDLAGKTGTAEVAGGPAHGWFVGIIHDVAFAVFIKGADASQPAVDMAGQFIDEAGVALDD